VAGGDSQVLNVGYGHGCSVREVLASVERVAGQKLVVHEEPGREGDPPTLVAATGRVRQVLGWQPRLDDLDTIVRHALAWERKLQREPW
jgi:UDP-glucose 4-epimerase